MLLLLFFIIQWYKRGAAYYWFTSGTPTYLIEMLKKFQVMPSDIGRCEADKSEFDVALENMNSILPILYQSGYITIKGYDPETELFTLDIPNMEVKKAWMWLEDIYAFRKEGINFDIATHNITDWKIEDYT